MLNRALRIALKRHDRKPKNTRNDDAVTIQKLISSVTNMFIFPVFVYNKIVKLKEEKRMCRSERREIWDDQSFSFRFRHHFVVEDTCNNEFVVELLTKFHSEICYPDDVWTF